MTIHVHFMANDKLIARRDLEAVPRCGDECRFTFGKPKFYKVVHVVWCFDEGRDRANVLLIEV